MIRAMNQGSGNPPSSQPSGDELLSQIAGGDRDSFALLYDLYSHRLFGLIVYILGNSREAEDVFQETLFQVWRRASQFDASRGSALAWLIQLARSRAIDHLRRRATSAKLIPAKAEALAADRSDSSHRSELDRLGDVEVVSTALARLSDEQRSAISLAFYKGLTHDEIARELTIPLGTAKQRIRRGMQKMRSLLNGSVSNHES